MTRAAIWQPELTGERLHLRPLLPSDEEALYALASDPLIWAGHPVTDRWQRPIFQIQFDSIMTKPGPMAVLDRAGGVLIGTSTFHNHKPDESEVEIGNTFLARSHWGGAFNRELKSLMLAHAFRHVERVVFRIGEANLRSRRACEKIGGRLTERREVLAGPHGPMPHVVYEITRENFAARVA